MGTHDTVAWVRGVSQCAKNLDHTHTHGTCFGSTADLTVPVLNTSNHRQGCQCYESYYQRVDGWSVEGISTEA